MGTWTLWVCAGAKPEIMLCRILVFTRPSGARQRHVRSTWLPTLRAGKQSPLTLAPQGPPPKEPKILVQYPKRPRESKYPILQVSGPKSHLGYGFWDQSPLIMGTWTSGRESIGSIRSMVWAMFEV